MGILKNLIVLASLGLLTYNTNPDRRDFNRQLADKIQKRDGTIASYIVKGVMSITDTIEVKNCVYFSIAQMVPSEMNNFSNRVVGIGMFGKWIIFNDI